MLRVGFKQGLNRIKPDFGALQKGHNAGFKRGTFPILLIYNTSVHNHYTKLHMLGSLLHDM
jgi:hypothetical protein